MKRFIYSLPVKTLAVFLFVIMTAAAAAGLLGITYMYSDGYYTLGEFDFYDTDWCRQITYRQAARFSEEYLPWLLSAEPSETRDYKLQRYEAEFSKDKTNFFYTLTDGQNKELADSREPADKYGLMLTYHAFVFNSRYQISCYVREPLSAQDEFYTASNIFAKIYNLRYILIAVTALAVIFALSLFIFLLCVAGRRKAGEGVVLNIQDKIPLDLHALIFVVLPLAFVFTSGFSIANLLKAMLALITGLAFCMTLATRLKAGRWWRNTVTFIVIRLVYIAIRGVVRAVKSLFSHLPVIWKTVLVSFAFSIFNLFLILLSYGGARGSELILWFIFSAAFTIFFSAVAIQLSALKKGGESIAGGELDYAVDTGRMFGAFKEHAKNLNSISSGMQKAVDERLRSERFKTELITNVSHDIKTPLTSIINYVDLLKKEPVENEKIAEYLTVLDRQSARLKKLTEDLVEASKAATGSLPVTFERTDLSELLAQSLGEYEQRFLASGLETVVSAPEKGIFVMADGRLLWRVFDNLLNNICKYSLENTRVYLDVVLAEDKAVITIKNISRYPLNVSEGELTERFVRGDSSRSTEGSGLGLSIARSLVELQKGSFGISVDGDLFKVIIRLNTL